MLKTANGAVLRSTLLQALNFVISLDLEVFHKCLGALKVSQLL